MWPCLSLASIIFLKRVPIAGKCMKEVGERNKGAYFQITTTNPVLLVLNGLVATFFRPFPWEISSAIVLFSALEALIFLVLIVFLFVKRGILTSFKQIFDKPILILVFFIFDYFCHIDWYNCNQFRVTFQV